MSASNLKLSKPDVADYRPKSPDYPPDNVANSPEYPSTSPAYRPISPEHNPDKKGRSTEPIKERESQRESRLNARDRGRPRKFDRPAREEFKKTVKDIYTRTLITKTVSLEMKYIGSNIKDILEGQIQEQYEGKCTNEGFIKPKSSKIITYSSGIIKGNRILFEVVFECQACFPVEGQLVNCVAKNITKAGIRAESSNEIPTPFVVFVSRDFQITNPTFLEIQEGDRFVARIIGQRFELNDTYISIIAEITDKTKYK